MTAIPQPECAGGSRGRGLSPVLLARKASSAALSQARPSDPLSPSPCERPPLWRDPDLRLRTVPGIRRNSSSDHGWGAEASFLAAFAEPLRRLGFRVLALDLPAHGRSAGTRTNLAACARAAHRIAASFSPIAGMIGHSLGGLISLWVAEGGAPLGFPIPVGKLALLVCPQPLPRRHPHIRSGP